MSSGVWGGPIPQCECDQGYRAGYSDGQMICQGNFSLIRPFNQLFNFYDNTCSSGMSRLVIHYILFIEYMFKRFPSRL